VRPFASDHPTAEFITVREHVVANAIPSGVNGEFYVVHRTIVW
jgi:hypothetical protein